MSAYLLRVAEIYADTFGNIAKTGNTLMIPNNMVDISSLIAGAMAVVKTQGGEAKA